MHGATNLLRHVLRAVALLFAGIASAAAQPADTVLIVPWTDVEPYFVAEPDGTISGAFPEIAYAIADKMGGIRLEFRHYPTLQAMSDAQMAGETTLFPGVEAFPRFLETNLFSRPIATASARLLVRAEDAASIDPATVRGKRIGIVPAILGSAPSDLLARNEAVPFGVIATAFVRFMQGDVDGLLIPEGAAYELAHSLLLDHRIVAVGEPVVSIDRVVLLHKSKAELMPALDAAIAALEADGTLSAIRARYFASFPPAPPQELTVGVTHFPPFQVIGEDGTLTGYAVETLRNLAALAGLDLTFRSIGVDEFARGPGTDTYDMLPQIAVTGERAQVMDFALAIDRDSWSIFRMGGTNGDVASLDDLVGRRIAVQGVNIGRRLVDGHGGIDAVVYETIGEVLDALKGGEVDAAVYSTEPFRAYLEEVGETDVVEVEPPIATTLRAPALRRGLGQVRERLNGVIPGYLISEANQELRDFWLYKKTPPFWSAERLRFAMISVAALIVSMLLLCGFLIWRHMVEARYMAELATVNDALDHKNVELRAMNRELIRSNRELDDFAFIASHDLKEPLRGVSINANFLTREALSEKAQSRVARMLALCVKMERLISDLLECARLGHTQDAAEPVDPRAIIEAVCSTLSDTLEEGNVEIVVDTDLPIVASEPRRIRIVFDNLIVNAINYNKSVSKRINIGFEKQVVVDGRQLNNVFYVRDNGIGMDPKFHDEVFRMFRRLDSEKDSVAGTGAGLFFVRRIVEERGGIIVISSQLGMGATFYFSLPLHGSGTAAVETHVSKFESV